MNVLCVGHAMKGSVSPVEARNAMIHGVLTAGGTPLGLAMSDGGDGFLEAYAGVFPCETIMCQVTGPQGFPVSSHFLWNSRERTVIIESSLINGLALVPESERHTLDMTSAGLADALVAALQYEPLKIILGLGGSASTDGGFGFIKRLQHSVMFIGNPQPLAAKNMIQDESPVDMVPLRNFLSSTRLEIYVDITNPLLGETGTARTFARQKGASNDDILLLENLISEWSERLTGIDVSTMRNLPGAGAAGGLGFALAALGGRLMNGAESFSDLIGLKETLKNQDVMLITEGRFDETGFRGKAPWYAAEIALSVGVQPIILCGTYTRGAYEKAVERGVKVIAFGEALHPGNYRTESGAALSEATAKVLKSAGSGN